MMIPNNFPLFLTSLLFTRQAVFIVYVSLFLGTLQVAFGFQENQGNDFKLVDLEEIATDAHAEIPLDNDWEFYWNTLIDPGNFNTETDPEKVTLRSWTAFGFPAFGYATYRLQFSIPKERPEISLYVPSIYASSKLWVNGKLISNIGHVSNSKSKIIHRRFSQIIPLDRHETHFEIVIQVANFYHHKGGIDKPLLLSKNSHFQTKKSIKTIADMIFIGSLSFIGIFFLLFFLLYWNKDRAVLYFGVLCIALAYMALSDRYAPFAYISDSISWIVLTRIEYITVFLAGASASLFFYTIFSSFVSKTYVKIVAYIFCGLTLLVALLPAPYFTYFIRPFLVFMIPNLIYVTFVIIKAITSKRHESILLLTSTLLASLIFYAHIFLFLGDNGNAIMYVNLGYIIVFLLLSMLLMTRFSESFHELEKAKEFALEQKKEISLKSNQLSKVNLELQENLSHLKKTNAELDSFNHIVSHDLKAPLVAMHSLISFIEEDLEAVENEEIESHFNSLKDRVSKMYAMIDDLLEYSKITKGNKVKEAFSLNGLLREVLSVVENLDKHVIHLPEVDTEMYANKVELQHVFQNLISNAIKHNDKEKAMITISFVKYPNEYVFSVRDNGPGIDAKYHQKIFEMFSQLHINNEVESTGIGLSIVKKIVNENQGEIWVDSKAGAGTTIQFSWKILKRV